MRASLTLSITGAVLIAAFAGCAGASDPPLGGPYGGTASITGPTTGTSTSPTDPATDSTTTDAGAEGSSGSSDSSGSSGSSGTSGTSGSSGSSGSSGGTGVTWTQIWTTYLAPGTPGNCAKSGCHSQTGTASGAYTWLKGRGYIRATNAPLADPTQSCLTWLGGNMPPGGAGSNTAATTALTTWAASGAPNN